MEINRAAFGALAVIGVVAAGSGAYLANRHTEPATMRSAPVYSAPVAVVTETENSIATTPAAAVQSGQTKPVLEPAPVRSARRAPVPARAPVGERTRSAERPAAAPAPTSAVPNAPIDPPVSAAIEPLDSTTV